MPSERAFRATIGVAAALLAVQGCNPSSQARRPATVVAQPHEASFAETWDRRAFDHDLWDAVVRAHVNERGLVRYDRIGDDPRFKEYLYRLANTDAAGLADNHQRLAFWVNGYNALTIKAVLDTLPADQSGWPDYSIRDQKVDGRSIWKGLVFEIGGGQWTLDRIEHDILRRRDGLRDPRIHVAIVCAARGCPHLWNRAYDPKTMDEQLAMALRRYVNDPSQCRIDVANRTLTLTRIFDWYGEDFTSPRFSPNAPGIPDLIARHVSDPATADALRTRKWKLEYLDYDWKLNLAR